VHAAALRPVHSAVLAGLREQRENAEADNNEQTGDRTFDWTHDTLLLKNRGRGGSTCLATDVPTRWI
jgi:hypothetical protein